MTITRLFKILSFGLVLLAIAIDSSENMPSGMGQRDGMPKSALTGAGTPCSFNSTSTAEAEAGP